MKIPLTVSLADVFAARKRLRGVIVETPCVESPALSELTGCRIFCKQEYLQHTGSFKERGARNALAQLIPEQAANGVIAASAGNHALGLAWHGRELGIAVTVVMPRSAPLIKVARCRQFGANVVLSGETFDEARQEANRLAAGNALTYLHPFDNAQVIAGQGTVGLEILEQAPEAEAVLVPVGGGGLLAGVSTAIHAIRPELKIVGVEPAHAACFAAGLAAQSPVRIATQPTLADGLAVAEAGLHTLAIARPLIDRLVAVEENDIARALLHLAAWEKCLLEGSAAVGLAALLGQRLPELQGRCVVLLLTGRNIDPQIHAAALRLGRTQTPSSVLRKFPRANNFAASEF